MKWEYRVKYITPAYISEPIEKILNEYGSDRWELTAISADHLWVFKRQVVPEKSWIYVGDEELSKTRSE